MAVDIVICQPEKIISTESEARVCYHRLELTYHYIYLIAI